MSREGWAAYPWQALRDSQDYLVVTYTQLPANVRQIWNGPGSPPIVPTPASFQFEFERNGDTSYSPWIPISCNNLVIPTPRVDNPVNVTTIIHANMPGVAWTTRTVNL